MIISTSLLISFLGQIWYDCRMNEGFPKKPITQERNLTLERQESVKSHNDLLKDYNEMPQEDKNWNVEKNTTNNPDA